MRGIAAVVLLALAACAAATATTPTAGTSSATTDWQTPLGKPPSKAEFAALFAACQDKIKSTAENGLMDGCLADLGLRRIQ